MINSPTNSLRRRNIHCNIKNFAILLHKSITALLCYSPFEIFAANFQLVGGCIVAADKTAFPINWVLIWRHPTTFKHVSCILRNNFGEILSRCTYHETFITVTELQFFPMSFHSRFDAIGLFFQREQDRESLCPFLTPWIGWCHKIIRKCRNRPSISFALHIEIFNIRQQQIACVQLLP